MSGRPCPGRGGARLRCAVDPGPSFVLNQPGSPFCSAPPRGALLRPGHARSPMPELPEVETVRRGLAPVMEGARFVEVVANRGDLRWPLPKDFVKRLKGRTVSGLGRRAKYLLADLSSGDVLVMHLGMSGSFRVERDGSEDSGVVTPGAFYHDRSKDLAHD